MDNALKASRPKSEGECAVRVRGLLQARRRSCLIDIKWELLWLIRDALAKC